MKPAVMVAIIVAVTVVLVAVGTIWPTQSTLASAGVGPRTLTLRTASTPQDAVDILLRQIGARDWRRAYASLANRNEFTETEFIRDLTGSYGSLRTYASLEGFDIKPLHATDNEADIRADLRWSTIVGIFRESRQLKVMKEDNRWHVAWPVVKEAKVPPQVIPVNYLRWDVVYRGPEDDWGAQDVEAPHVRIVAMHPVDRAGNVVLLGELLNEDVVPAFVTVKATLLAKDGSAMATEGSFDKIVHTLLPKQVTPFRIDFRGVRLSDIDSVRMEPSSTLVAASADPVIGIESQKMNPAPHPSLTGQLVNQSGQVANVTHVLGTFYDSSGQIVWVSDEYPDRALLPGTPVAFSSPVPNDLAGKVNNFRVVTSTYSPSRFQ